MRRTRTTVTALGLTDAQAVSAYRWSIDGCGTDHILGEPHFATEAEARAAWPRLRRACWARAHRFAPPDSAEYFDGVTRESWNALWSGWQHGPPIFDLASVLAALGQDRANLTAFEQRDPRGAKSIADFLDSWLSDLDMIAAEAARVAGEYAAGAIVATAPNISSAQRYGGTPHEAAAMTHNDD